MYNVHITDNVDISHPCWLMCNFSFINLKYQHYPDNVNVNNGAHIKINVPQTMIYY